MDPQELRNFERRPAFGIYPKGEKDPLPSHIRKIRDKWARLGVDLGTVWRKIRKGYDIYQETNLIDQGAPYQLTPRHQALGDYTHNIVN